MALQILETLRVQKYASHTAARKKKENEPEIAKMIGSVMWYSFSLQNRDQKILTQCSATLSTTHTECCAFVVIHQEFVSKP